MKKTLLLFITFLSFLSCTSNEENLDDSILDEVNNNQIHTVKITIARSENSEPFMKIKFEGLPIQEQNNKWMPIREDIRYDAINDHIEFMTRWEADNDILYLYHLDEVNTGVTGEYWTEGTTFKSYTYNFIEILPNEMFWKTRVSNWDTLSTFKVGFSSNIIEFSEYYFDDNLIFEFSFEVKMQLK